MRQRFDNISICVYDNASGDETESVVRELMQQDHRISYVKNDENIGCIANFYKGVEAVETDYYSILSDDDILLENFYADAMQEVEKNTSLGFVCLKTMVIDDVAGRVMLRESDWKAGVFSPSKEVVRRMSDSHFTSTGVLFSKKLRDAVGPFDASGDDALYVTMAAGAFPFSYLDNYGAVWIQHEEGYTATTGLRGKDAKAVRAQMLVTLNRCMNLDIPDDRKAQLIAIISDAYRISLEWLALKSISLSSSSSDQSDSELIFDSSLSYSGIILAFTRLPPPLSKVALVLYRGAVVLSRKVRVHRRRFQGAEIPGNIQRLLKIR
ncbi:MAG: glycosyltransferase involved in cell wall biosynthesis [Halieaceae bacterium]|jgi:glycosyltransferase involved in cell wall biosynthesis